MGDKLQAYDLLEMLILKLAFLNLDDNHHLMLSSHGLYVKLPVMHIHDIIPNPYRQHKHTYVMG
jgi:hypothetical protein